MPLLTTLGYSLPELLGCGIALALLWSGAAPGKPRNTGLLAVGILFACALLQLGIGFYQNWAIQNASGTGAEQLQRVFMLLGVVRLLINCVYMAGVVLLAWALCQATRPRRETPPLL